MKVTAKVAVSMPTETLRALDAACGRLRRSRSAMVSEAVAGWLRGLAPTEADRRYVEGYLRRPERTDTTEAVARAAIAAWEPWE
jgi:metal-responsive CopG/Arc/MetJ family transcriptional regulator